MNDLISRQSAIEAMESVDYYHLNRTGEMVHGANPDEHQAWYKMEDVYKALDGVSSAQTEKRIVRPIISKRLIYIYNPDPIRFFFWGKPEGLLIANFRFRVRHNRHNSKNLNKLHILIRSPLFCIERNNGGTTIGNKHQLFFVKHAKHRAERKDNG